MMERFEELNKLIAEQQEVIKERSTILSSLQEELYNLASYKWIPPNGEYVVGGHGKVINLSKMIDKEWVNPEFGNVRRSKSKAEKLARNQKTFNRISAYFDDTAPIIEIEFKGDYSVVSLNFYDYSGSDLSIFKRDVIC